MARAREPLPGRILRNIHRDGECWIWTGSHTRDGYGVLTIGKRQYRAHRASYMAFNGPLDDRLVCHSCDTPLCVNPDHLFLGTPKQNTQDMMAKGRRATIAGPSHPSTKILPEQRRIMFSRRNAGEPLRKIAADFDVCFQSVSRICQEEARRGTAK